MNNCLIIIGMGRSGTSLVSSVLQKSGLFIGDSLLGATPHNINGHFENVDFYNFHKKALAFLSLNTDGWVLQTIEELNNEFEIEAREIIKQNSREQWGWKDPRTTLFLPFWEKLIPEAKYIFLYRNPWDVADSLFRRAKDPFMDEDPVLALKFWDFYNKQIINMYKKHEAESILINIDDILNDIPSFIIRINRKLGFYLNEENSEIIYDKTIFTPAMKNDYRIWQVSVLLPQVIKTLNELRRLTGKNDFVIPDLKNQREILKNGFYWEELQNKINDMEGSKFLKLRTIYKKIFS
jgi:hypothetical protein